MDMPKNCIECEKYKDCQSHFGGIGCDYREKIAEKAKEGEMLKIRARP